MDGVDSGAGGLDISGIDPGGLADLGYGGMGSDPGNNGYFSPAEMDMSLANNTIGWDSFEGGGYFSPAEVDQSLANQQVEAATDNSFWGRLNQFAQTPLGRVAQFALTKANPTLGMIANIAQRGYQASQSPAQAGRAIGGMAGSVGLGSMFGPAGSLVGGQIGGYAGQSMLGGLNQGYSGPGMGNQPGQEGGIGLGTGGLLGLAALYQGSRNAREIDGQMSSLQSLYGANSPFAQQAMQAIQRQGAKGGRRTSGNRADAAGLTQNQVQLQSLLAQNAARLAPTLAQMQQFRQGNRGQTLANLAGLYQKMGGMPGIQSGLDGLYSSVNGALNGFEAYDPSGYGMPETFTDQGTRFTDILPDTWGG